MSDKRRHRLPHPDEPRTVILARMALDALADEDWAMAQTWLKIAAQDGDAFLSEVLTEAFVIIEADGLDDDLHRLLGEGPS